nr:hypothetical protein [Tanacetum cinerariifolium]
MYYKKNLDFVSFIWEDLAYQIDNIDLKKQDKMFYPRFTKIIIHHFLTKDKFISWRNRINMHTARDDSILGTMRFVSRHANTQVYGAILLKAMTNQARVDSVVYKTYHSIASGAEPPKPIKGQKKFESTISSMVSPSKKKTNFAKLKTVQVTPEESTKKSKRVKKPAKKSTTTVVIEDTPGESVSKKKTPAKGDKGKGEGTGSKPGVPDVPKYDSESDKESCRDSDEEDNDDEDESEDESNKDKGDDDNDANYDDNDADDDIDDDDINNDDEETDSERTESDRVKIPDPNLSEEHREEDDEYSDERVHTPSSYEINEEKIDDEEKLDEEEDDEVTKELYKDVNVNLGNKDDEMTDAEQGGADQQNVSQESVYEQEEEDAHVILTTIHDAQKTDGATQSSSVSFDFTSKLLNLDNPSPTDITITSLMDTIVSHEEPTSQTSAQYTVPVTAIPEITFVFAITVPSPPHFFNPPQQQATLTPTPTTYKATTSTSVLLDFASMFKFNKRVTNLERTLSEIKQVNHFRLCAPVIEKKVTESHEAAVLPRSSSQSKSTYEAAASLSEFELTKIVMDKMKENKSHLAADYKRELYDALVKSYNTDKDLFDSYGKEFTLKRGRDDQDKDQDPFDGSDRGTKRRKSSKEAESSEDLRSKKGTSSSSSKGTSRSHHKSSGNSAHAEEPTPKRDWYKKQERPPTPYPDWDKRQYIKFRQPQTWISDTAQAEEPPTSFDELNDTSFNFFAFVMNRLKIPNMIQEILVGLTFNLLKGTCKSKSYPFDLRKPLPLITNHRGLQVIPQDYFINNDMEYLKGGSLSRKYSTFVTKIKAATYEINWIEDMLRNIWSPVKVKLTNLTIDERYDLNVALCMFTRHIFIQKRVENLQLGVKIYQKKINLTKPDTFKSDLRNKTPNTSYSDPQGVIYVDQLNKNRLMRTDELYKFSDGTLDFVRTTLHDIASGIRMEYMPKKHWSNFEKKRARVMIQNIDKQLFERRLMRNLEKFVGGRKYETDLRLLERTI